MSGVILPWWEGARPIVGPERGTASTQEIRIPRPEIPGALRLDIEANPKIEPLFLKAVGAALSSALVDRETAPLLGVTDRLLKEWVEMCYEVASIMRYDLGMSLRRICDVLPDEFVDALRSGVRPADMVEKRQQGQWWKRHGAEEEDMVMKKVIGEDQSGTDSANSTTATASSEENQRLMESVDRLERDLGRTGGAGGTDGAGGGATGGGR